jgi:hypothetical protein
VKSRFLLPIALLIAVLQGCGGGGGSDDEKSTSAVRLVNATTEYSSLDGYVSDTKVISAVTSFAASGYVSPDEGSNTFKLKATGSSTSSAQTTVTLTKDTYYSLLAYVSGDTLQILTLTEAESTPASGYAKLKTLNASTEAGAVDVYLTGVGEDIANATAIAGSVSGTSGAFVDVGAGTYRVRVTGAGDKSDIRLDIPSVSIGDQKVLNLLLTTTGGGVLVHGTLITQQGTVTAYKNTAARVRLVADVAANGTVTASANGVSLAASLKSPVVGSYALVTAGSLSMTASVNGATVTVPDLTATAGDDLTLLVMGSAAAPTFTLIGDNNRPASSGYAKVRLLNGVNGSTGPITMTIDYGAVASNVASGGASTTTSVSSGTGYRVEATSSASSASLFVQTDVSLQTSKVYTLFMLGDDGAPVGILRRDR